MAVTTIALHLISEDIFAFKNMSRIIITTNKGVTVLEDERLISITEEKASPQELLIREVMEKFFRKEIQKKELIYEVKCNTWISITYKNINGSTNTDVSTPKLICSFDYSEYIKEVDGEFILSDSFIINITHHLLWRLISANQDANILQQKK